MGAVDVLEEQVLGALAVFALQRVVLVQDQLASVWGGGASVSEGAFGAGGTERDLTWLICLVREFGVSDGVEDDLLFGGNVGGECLGGAVDGDGR